MFWSPPRSSKTASTFRARTPSSSIAPTAWAFPSFTSFAAASAARTSAPTPICSFRTEGSLTSIARQRLAALKEFSDLGAGFRIAALDLELRGAGNLLGGEQHGHIEAVGFDMYCQMMERAVAERKGEAVAPERRATLNLGQDIRIPPEYIESENLRLRIYKRIASVTSEAERDEVRTELDDRFGPPPPAVVNLLDYAVLEGLAEKLLVAHSRPPRRSDWPSSFTTIRRSAPSAS